jgi:O-succinylbenzoic acid--CoA ligase
VFKSRLHIFEFKKTAPDFVFLASKDGMYTYNDLDRFTAFFQDILIQRSDSLKWPVAFLSDSSDMLVFSIAACWQLGVPFIPLDPKLTQEELEAQISALSPSLIFCDSKNRKRIKSDDIVHMDENYFINALTFDIANSELPNPMKFEKNDVFGYFFTSGTSGTPKIVPLKRRQMYSAAKSSAKNLRPDPNHFWLLCLPLNHIGGISIILRSIIYGTGIYRLDVFHEEMIKEFLAENSRFQAASLVPTMLKRILKDPLFRTHRDFKAVLLGGGPSNEKLLQKAVERGIPMISSYGMTETCAQIVANPMLVPSGTYTPLTSVGKPFSANDVEIRDEIGKRQPMNESGLIWLKGPQVFDGYYPNEEGDSRFDDKGWFNSGDYGHLNGNGHLFIESRRTDLIVSGGENINPYEVEQAIEGLDEIQEAAVIGIEDDEKVVAVVTLSNGVHPNLDFIKTELQGKIADFKHPKELKIVDELPRTATGKIKRKELKSRFSGS